jgi:hypothetical protein
MASAKDDEQLRLRALRLTDPYDQLNLIWSVPKNAALLTITNVYTYERWPQRKVFCAACQSHRHKRGFTALLASGERLLLGSSCGAELFGQSWWVAEKALKELGDRQHALGRVDRIKLIDAPMLAALSGWRNVMEKVVARRDSFDRIGELASRVWEAANAHGGNLVVVRKVESRAARAAGMRGAADYAASRFASLPGRALFDRSLDPVRALDHAAAAIRALSGAAEGTANLSTTVLARRGRGVEDAFADLERIAGMHAAAQEFFARRTFELLVDWAGPGRLDLRTRYELDGDRVLVDGKGRMQVLEVPDIDQSPLDLVAEYRRAD